MTNSAKQCFNCRKPLEKRVTFCPYCSAPLPLHGSLFPMLGDLLLRLVSMLLLGFFGCVFGIFGVSLINVNLLAPGASPFEIIGRPFIGVIFCGLGLYFLWCALQLLKND
jgi:hypothetical protein